jgi:hypothetical protein
MVQSVPVMPDVVTGVAVSGESAFFIFEEIDEAWS